MAHICTLCKKEMSKTEYVDSVSIGGDYYICPDCKKYIDIKNTSVANYEKYVKLIDVSCQYEEESWLKNYYEKTAEKIKTVLSEQEIEQAEVFSKQTKLATISENRSKAAESFADRINQDIVLVTTDFVTDHSIKHMLGPVSGCTAIGAGFFKSYLASLSATFGTTSGSFSEKVSKARFEAERAMLNEAKALGANAVIDVHYAISNFAADLTGILVTGTAVVVE